MSRQRAESMLKGEDKEGCFVVRNSSTKGLYTLSLFTKIPHPQVHTSNMICKRGFLIHKPPPAGEALPHKAEQQRAVLPL